MRNVCTLLVLGALVLAAPPRAFAIDAAKWMTLAEDMQRGYVTAVVDTWANMHGMIKGPERSHAETIFAEVVECINRRKFSYDDIYAAALDYTKRREDRRQYNMAAVTWIAVSEMCKK